MKIKILFAIAIMTICTGNLRGQGKVLAYTEGSAKLNGFYAAPTGKSNSAGILILPAWMGITAHEKTTAQRLSKLGYHVLAADIYGDGNQPKNPQEAGKLAGYYKSNIEKYHERIKAALNTLIKQGASPSQIAVMGYCFGGTGAIECARENFPVKAVISFHGGLGRDSSRTINPIKPKLLILHGANDPYESEQEIKAFQQEMKTAKADWQMIYLPNAVHAFTDPAAGTDPSKGAAYNEQADKRSWEYMLVFLKEIF
ncbi:dienelactone hydrolase family protein [Pedobacter sp. HMF7647]|uniref:Dienelactone hydrolase family protein n=1 Tax=Hufsiella arboris TaxID=2695275 RepID=A0A7K1Y6H4_9SPHI|nr:dienelactone hydrolase family protein [Hufsiella arboris]MXV50174.1 dienelactone hydrolase family protein [Hufsiella arboris]